MSARNSAILRSASAMTSAPAMNRRGGGSSSAIVTNAAASLSGSPACWPSCDCHHNDLADAYVSIVDVDPLVAPRHRLTAQTLTEAIESAANAIDSVGAAIRHDSRADTFRARVGGAAPIEATVIVASGCQGSIGATFSPRRGAVLVMASDRAAIAEGGARIEISGDGASARLEPLGIDFTPVRLDASTADALAAATVAVVDLPEVEPDAVDPSALGPHAPDEGGNDEVRPSVEPFTVNSPRVNGHEHGVDTAHVLTVDFSAEQTTSDAPSNAPGEPTTDSDGQVFAMESTRPELVVRVLGVPSIPDRPDIGRRELILAELLACRGGTLAASAAQDALWGGKPVEPKTVWNFVAAVRRALGDFDDGTPVMPAADRAHGTLRLHPRVTTDLDLLRRAIAAADEMSSTEAMSALRDALSMVDGPPFDAVGYDWAHRDQDVAEAARAIEQTVDRLVALALEAGQHDLARHAMRVARTPGRRAPLPAPHATRGARWQHTRPRRRLRGTVRVPRRPRGRTVAGDNSALQRTPIATNLQHRQLSGGTADATIVQSPGSANAAAASNNAICSSATAPPTVTVTYSAFPRTRTHSHPAASRRSCS